MMILDGIQPVGITSIILDKMGLPPCWAHPQSSIR